MPRALKVCSRAGCPNLVVSGRCVDCDRAAEAKRGIRQERGYGRAHVDRFRRGVLRRDPICVCPDVGRHGHPARCFRPSTRADHFPASRRELIARGLDADDPRYGRGLCGRCDSAQTAVRQPGGWAAG